MGTRNLTCVVKDGVFKVAQYGQWDGYFSGQGETVKEFIIKRLKDPEGLREFKKHVETVRPLTEKQIKKCYIDLGIMGEWMDQDESARFKAQYPQLNRDMGAEILEYIWNNENVQVNLQVEFAADSLFCEYCYVLDLDQKMLEVYTGFNTKPLKKKNRFSYLSKCESARGASEDYYHIKLFAKIPFSKVTKNTMKELQKKEDKLERE